MDDTAVDTGVDTGVDVRGVDAVADLVVVLAAEATVL